MIIYLLYCLLRTYTFDIILDEHCQLVEINSYLKVRCRADKQSHKLQKREVSITTVDDTDYEFRCWNSEILYSVTNAQLKCDDPAHCCAPEFTKMCEEDDRFYQLCGFTDTTKCMNYNLDTSMLFCGNYICSFKSKGRIVVPYPNYATQHSCITHPDCEDPIKSYCDDDTKKKCAEEDNYISEIGVCDGINDCSLGSDELNCLHPYGVECFDNHDTKVRRWVPDNELCDSNIQCYLGYDEHNGTCYERKKKNASCSMRPADLAAQAPDRVCRDFKYKEKGDEPPCSNGHDQMDCKGDEVLLCYSTFDMEDDTTEDIEVSLSNNLICDGYTNCVDGIDEDCLVVGYDCYIHKHRLCDGVQDCPHGEDELDYMCLENELTSEKRCIRRVDKYRRLQRLPHLWLCDGVVDCEDEMDENRTNWHECKHTQAELPWQLHHAECVEHKDKCVSWFICPENGGYALPTEAVCNGMVHSECPEEAKICAALNAAEITREVHPFRKRDNTVVKYISFCVPGIIEYGQFDCEEKEYTFFEDIFGVSKERFILPREKMDCRNVYGEEYVLLACIGKCEDNTTECPLSDHPPEAYKCTTNPTIQHVYLKAPSQKGWMSLIKHHKIDPELFESDLYSCDNENCIPISNVCDLDNNCGDWSDEIYCNNSFKCKNSNIRIPWGHVCDGEYDCVDFSDECNSHCSKSLIQNLSLSVCAWIFGLFSFGMNLVVVIKSVRKCFNVRSNTSFVNYIFMSLISVGNFLTGIYLIGIAIANTVYYTDYCTKRYEWRLSSSCSFLGAIQVVGCQVTLFNMLVLALYRGYVTRFATRPSNSHKAVVIKILIVWIMVVIASVTLASVPIISTWNNFFINGYHHRSLSGMFLGAPDKHQHLEILSSYHGHIKADLKWVEILSMVEHMFALPEGVTFSHDILNFYGSNSVCLFKYFVTEKDPQRQYIVGVTFLNVTCNIVMCTAYFIIIAVSKTSSRSTNKSIKNRALKKRIRRQQAMVHRITIIIVIGVITWLPIVIICFLHYNSAIDASAFYDYIAILAFPLGSLVHPLVCDKVLRDGIKSVLKKMSVTAGIHRVSMFEDGQSIGATSIMGPSTAPANTRRVEYSVSGTSDNESIKSEGAALNNRPETSITILSARPSPADPFRRRDAIVNENEMSSADVEEEESDRRVRFQEVSLDIPRRSVNKPLSLWKTVSNVVRPLQLSNNGNKTEDESESK